MTPRKGQSAPHAWTLQKPLGLGVPYSLLLTPCSYLPSPPWFRNLYLTKGTPTEKQAEVWSR